MSCLQQLLRLPPDSSLELSSVLCGGFSAGEAGAEETERGVPTVPIGPESQCPVSTQMQDYKRE